jgi:hypothetical protein
MTEGFFKRGKRVAEWADKQPSWQGLTDDEIQAIRIKTFDAVATNYEAYRAIEQALKEKNHGASEGNREVGEDAGHELPEG